MSRRQCPSPPRSSAVKTTLGQVPGPVEGAALLVVGPDQVGEFGGHGGDALGPVVAHRFELRRGHSPSSTVTILRTRDQHAGLFVLGDSPLYYGTAHQANVLVDTRLADLDLPESRRYRDRLRNGSDYDDKHRTLLRRLREHQRAWRNVDGGYWIAEADATAAHHAVTATLGVHDLSWVVLATDGRYSSHRPSRAARPRASRWER